MSLTRSELAARLRSVVRGCCGDDLERARAAFRHHSEAEMDCQHGQSGRTCREILNGYEQGRGEDEQLVGFVDELLDGPRDPDPEVAALGGVEPADG